MLSAYGMGLADQTTMKEQAVEIPLGPDTMRQIETLADTLAADAVAALQAQGAEPADVTTARTLHLRYAGTEAALIVPLSDLDTVNADFTAAHRARFGFATPERPVVVETVAAEATLPGTIAAEATLPARQTGAPEPIERVRIFTGGAEMEAPVLERTSPCSPATASPAPPWCGKPTPPPSSNPAGPPRSPRWTT